jgi:hypothetical protein
MNKLPVYLYPNKIDVIFDTNQTRGIYKVMYQRKIKIQKGFKDSVQIQFKNSDQKPVFLSTTTNYYVDLIDTTGRELVFSKKLSVIDNGVTTSTKGLAVVTFNPLDTINLQAASYKFLVKKDNGDGTFTPAYANTYYEITGDIEIVEDGFAIGYPIQTVDIDKLETGKAYDRTPNSMGYIFVSEWLRPKISSTYNSTTSTAAVTLASFAGEITVEATIDSNPSPAGQANAQAFTVTNYISSTAAHGIIQLSWTGAYTAVRFKIKPKNDAFGVNYYPTGNPIGSNNNKFPNGFVDQIQYFS